jgi:bacterioferritin-associated ferredoxin
MYVCHCSATTDRTVDAAIASGARSVAEVTARCRAGGGCGGCHRRLQALIDASSALANAGVATSAA